MAERRDFQEIVDLLEAYLLGSGPTLSGQQIADELGIELSVAQQRWRSLGFTGVDDDAVMFTEADLEAMRLTQQLRDIGVLGEDENAMVRALGRSFARLAEWQLELLGATVDPSRMSVEEMAETVTEVVPIVERIQNYVWRRHIIAAAARLLLEPPAPGDSPEEAEQAVGFADIVGYTRQSRSLALGELTDLVDGFEARALAVITEHGGRLIKTIGDEVLFATDTPRDAALIGLELVAAHRGDESFPQLRVGIAWGRVLTRLGDVYGPTVNIAARLTSLARPGRVLVDKDLAEALADDAEFRLRRVRRASVRGYRRLEPWVLRHADDDDLPVTEYLQDRGADLTRVVDEMQSFLGSIDPRSH